MVAADAVGLVWTAGQLPSCIRSENIEHFGSGEAVNYNSVKCKLYSEILV